MIKKSRHFCIFDIMRIVTLFVMAAIFMLSPSAALAQPSSEDGGELPFVELDISEGSILITDSGYSCGEAEEIPFTGVYVITGRSDEAYGIEVTGGEHTLIFKDLVIDQRTLRSSFPLRVKKAATVALKLNGDIVLYAGSGNSGIALESGAVLDISAYGSGSLSVQSYPEKNNNIMLGEHAVNAPSGSSISYPTGKAGDTVRMYGGTNRKEFAGISAYSGQPYLRIEYDIAHLNHKLSAEPDCTHDQICLLCGEVVRGRTQHVPGDAATCTQPQRCAVCGAVISEPSGHKGVWKVIEYTDYGLYRRESMTCTICGETLNRTVATKN